MIQKHSQERNVLLAKEETATYNVPLVPKMYQGCTAGLQKAKGIPSMRIELTTLGLLDPRSNQLSYEGLQRWWSS